jgi:integrase/recombinase XerD
MRDPAGTVVLGPLEPFAGGFVVELSAHGYTAGSAVQQMCLMAHLSRWLAAEDLGPAALSPAVVERFCCARRAAGYRSLLSPRALDPLLAYLRRLGVVPAARTPVPDGPVEELLSRYRRYLEIERGLVTGSARVYVHWVRPFLEGLADEDGLD